MSSHQRPMLDKLAKAMASRYPLVYLLGWDEPRMEALLRPITSRVKSPGLVIWTATTGFSAPFGGDGQSTPITDPVEALAWIAARDTAGVYLLKDLPAWFEGNPRLVRAVRDLYAALRQRDVVVFMSHPELVLPEVLKKEIFLIEVPLPAEDEILEVLTERTAGRNIQPEHLHRLAGALRGLSQNEIQHVVSRLLLPQVFDHHKALLEAQEEKSQLLRKESVLRFYGAEWSMKDVGGLDQLRDWVLKRKYLFSERALSSGVPLPSGLLLMGVSGCGKSMAAKAIAAAWELPLVRLDMSLVLSGSFGTPEYAFENAARLAAEIAPIVLWIDEIENAFGFDRAAHGGGNVNILSSFLTWMQEKSPKVFIAATANRIQELPAEFMRKGRFDQLFFLDLPNKKERAEILRIHITRHGGDPTKFNLDYLAAATREWSGAEIEQAVKSARIDAYQENRAFTEQDVARGTTRMVPLSRTMTEQIKAIRDWSFQRAIPASTQGPV